MDYRETKRLNFARAIIDAFDRDWNATLHNRVVSQLLEIAGISWRTMLDRLRGLQKDAWLNEWREIVQKVESAIDQNYIQAKRAEIFNAIQYPSGNIEVRSVSRAKIITTVVGPKGEVFYGSRFTEADEKTFFEITRGSLPGYVESREMWVETLVIHYKKKTHGDEIDIGIRAPLKQYGKAFRVWLRTNNIHLYPATPYTEERTGETWVYRVYHTRGWKENLKKRLKYLRALEDRAVGVVAAARKLEIQDIKKQMSDVSVPADDAQEILSNWKGGTLWDLISLLHERKYIVALLSKHGLLEEPQQNN